MSEHADNNHELLAQELQPLTSATLTIRIVKSFTYRTSKNLVLRELDLTRVTVGELMARCREKQQGGLWTRDGLPAAVFEEELTAAIQSTVGFKLYRNITFDTLKLYTAAHGHKNLIINLDHDEWILSDESKTLAEVGCQNETELSLFNRDEYEAFKSHPETKWQ